VIYITDEGWRQVTAPTEYCKCLAGIQNSLITLSCSPFRCMPTSDSNSAPQDDFVKLTRIIKVKSHCSLGLRLWVKQSRSNNYRDLSHEVCLVLQSRLWIQSRFWISKERCNPIKSSSTIVMIKLRVVIWRMILDTQLTDGLGLDIEDVRQHKHSHIEDVWQQFPFLATTHVLYVRVRMLPYVLYVRVLSFFLWEFAVHFCFCHGFLLLSVVVLSRVCNRNLCSDKDKKMPWCALLRLYMYIYIYIYIYIYTLS